MSLFGSLFSKKKDGGIKESNPELLRAMHLVATNDNPDNRKRLYEAMLAASFWVPVPETPSGLGPGLQVANSATEIQLSEFTDANGVRATAAFTDEEALRNWDPNTPHLGLKSRDLFRAVLPTDIQTIVINPFDPIRKMIRPGGRVSRAEFEVLAEGIFPSLDPVQLQLRASEKIFIGKPASPPGSAIEELLRSKATDYPEVRGLYVFQMARQVGGSHTVIGIDVGGPVARDRQNDIAGDLTNAIRSELRSGQTLAFMFLSGTMREQIVQLGGEIYRRA